MTREELQAAAAFFPGAIPRNGVRQDLGRGRGENLLPLAGRNGEHGTDGVSPRTSLFGLAEHDMLADANQLKSDAAQGRIGYSMFSTTQNCAAVAARSLQAGGSNIYVPFEASWISEDPNKTYDYAELQGAIDLLNEQAGSVKAHCASAWSKAPAEADTIAQLRVALHARAHDLDAYDQTRQQAQGAAADQRIRGLDADVGHARDKLQKAERELKGLENTIPAMEKEVAARSDRIDRTAASLKARAENLNPENTKEVVKLNADRDSHDKNVNALNRRREELSAQVGRKARLNSAFRLARRARSPVRPAQRSHCVSRRGGATQAARGGGVLRGPTPRAAILRGRPCAAVRRPVQGLDARQQRQLAPLSGAVADLRAAVDAGAGMQALMSKPSRSWKPCMR